MREVIRTIILVILLAGLITFLWWLRTGFENHAVQTLSP